MGVIFSNDFITFTPTARNANSSYPATNISERWHLIRTFKSADATANDWLLKLDMASAQTVAAIVLNHVNFTSVIIQGHASDSWGSPSFTTTVSISQDPAVDRYKAFIPLTAFNYRYLRIFIPTGQTPTDDSVWYVGNVEVLDSYETLVHNATTFPRTSDVQKSETTIHGNTTDVITHGGRYFEGSLSFNIRKASDETELWTLNNLDPATPLVLYENLSDTSKVYTVIKTGAYKGTLKAGLLVSGNSISFKEIGL